MGADDTDPLCAPADPAIGWGCDIVRRSKFDTEQIDGWLNRSAKSGAGMFSPRQRYLFRSKPAVKLDSIRCARQIVLVTAIAGTFATWSCGKSLFESGSSTSSGVPILTPTPTGSAVATPTATSTPITQAFAFVTNQHDAKVTVFARDTNTGQLSPRSNADAGAVDGPAGVAIAPDNRAVYVANNADGNVYQYHFTPDAAALAPMTPASVSNAPNGGTEMLASDPANNLLFATNSREGTITSYRIDARTDAITPAASFALPGDSEPFGIAVDSAHSNIYVSDPAAGLVYGFSHDRSGTLKQVGGPATSIATGGGHPGALVLDKAGQSLYAVDASSGAVSLFSIERGRLTLSHMASSAAPGSEHSEDLLAEPMLMATRLIPSSPGTTHTESNADAGDLLGSAIADPNQRFVYTTGQLDGTVSVFALGDGCPSPRSACVKMTVAAEDPPSQASKPLGIALTH